MLNQLINHQVSKLSQGDAKDVKNCKGTLQPESRPSNNNIDKSPFDNLDKNSKINLVNKMKDEVPKVLLNKWLEISPEKSRFANPCLVDQDEISSCTEETLSNRLSVLSNSLKKKSINMQKQVESTPGILILHKGGSEQNPINKDEFRVKTGRHSAKPQSSKFVEAVQETDSSVHTSSLDNSEDSIVKEARKKTTHNPFLADSDYSVSDCESSQDVDDRHIKLMKNSFSKVEIGHLNNSKPESSRASLCNIDANQIPNKNTAKITIRKKFIRNIKDKNVLTGSGKLNLKFPLTNVEKNQECNKSKSDKEESKGKDRLLEIAQNRNQRHLTSLGLNSIASKTEDKRIDLFLSTDEAPHIRICNFKPMKLGSGLETSREKARPVKPIVSPIDIQFKLPSPRAALRSKLFKSKRYGSQTDLASSTKRKMLPYRSLPRPKFNPKESEAEHEEKVMLLRTQRTPKKAKFVLKEPCSGRLEYAREKSPLVLPRISPKMEKHLSPLKKRRQLKVCGSSFATLMKAI